MSKRKKPQVTKVRRADENHQVTTVESGGTAYRRTPCDECPWRRDSPVGAFPAEAYRISAPTAYDMARNTFACHMSGVKTPAICAGFLLRGADDNMAVRIAVMNRTIDFRKISDGGCDLYESYREMAEANGVDPDDPVLAPCRGD